MTVITRRLAALALAAAATLAALPAAAQQAPRVKFNTSAGEFFVEVGEAFDEVVFGRVELVWFDVFRHGLLSGRLR